MSSCRSLSCVCVLAALSNFVCMAKLYPVNSVNFQELPECEEGSVCGFVQLNPRGVSAQPFCRCPTGISCPLVWDLLDGRTISHGNDHYKYCGEAPRLDLCTTPGEDIVYSQHTEVSLVTMETIATVARMRCLCPPTHVFALNHTVFRQSAAAGVSAFGAAYVCKPPTTCSRGEPCLVVSETYSEGTTIYNRKCACPLGRFCPNDIRYATDKGAYDKGAYFTFTCK